MHDRDHITRIVASFEEQVDLYDPEGGPFGCRIIDYGELSVVLTLNELPGLALKRMSGFVDENETAQYVKDIYEYLDLLRQRGVDPLPARCLAVKGHTHVVYLVQELLNKERLGNFIVRTCDESELNPVLTRVADVVVSCLRHNRLSTDGIEAAADSQLSNWYFPESGEGPLLIDIGSPIKRINGKVEAFTEPIYRSGPWLIGRIFKLFSIAEDYFNDYFDLRLALLDLLGNLYKEQVADRIPRCIEIVNQWLENQPEGKDIDPVMLKEVKKYYRQDAFLLELVLQLRRFKRFTTNKIFRGRYDYILPGKIKRL